MFSFFLLLLALCIYGYFLTKRKKKKSTIYGSAEFKKRSNFRGSLTYFNKGFFIDNRRLTARISNNHMIVLGGSGSQKTQAIYLRSGFTLPKQASVVYHDPKGEMHTLISGYVKHKLNQEVFVLNLIEPDKSSTWNPLHNILEKDIQDLVASMFDIAQQQHKQDAFWRNGSILLITNICTILFHYEDGKYHNFANIYYLLQHLQIRDETFKRWLLNASPNESVKLGIQTFLSSESKIADGWLSGALSSLNPYCYPEVLEVSSSNTFPSLEYLRKKKCAVFLGLPVGSNKFSAYVSLFLSQLFKKTFHTDVNKSDNKIYFLLDEFGNLALPRDLFPQVISLVRQKKCSISLALQSLSQLTEKYGPYNAETIKANSGTWVVLAGAKDEKTLSYVSEYLVGTATVEHYDKHKDQMITTSRQLIKKDEIRRLKRGTGLVIINNEFPEKFKLRPLYKSWWLKRKYKLKSVSGTLQSTYPKVEHSNVTQTLEYIPFHTTSNNKETEEESVDKEFEALLKKHFPS